MAATLAAAGQSAAKFTFGGANAVPDGVDPGPVLPDQPDAAVGIEGAREPPDMISFRTTGFGNRRSSVTA